MHTGHPHVTAVTIVYGDRWKFLSRVIVSAMADPYIKTMIIVDNGSINSAEIQEGVKQYGEKIILIRHEKNLGSAGGFASGIARAKEVDCDYVLLLDDDSVLEEGSVNFFLNALTFFPDKKVVLSGSRYNVLANKEYFYKPSLLDASPRGTFFQVFSFQKLKHFFKLLVPGTRKEHERGPFLPIIPTEGFVYGGTFLPIEAVREAPLPDASLFLYGDDIEYSWNVKKLGYQSYLCSRPRLEDIDFTFGESSSHIFGQFEEKLAPFKVYFRIRNMVRLSRKHTKQSSPVLFLNIVFWMSGLFVLGVFRFGLTKSYWSRVWLMTKAVVAGYYPHSHFAKDIENKFPQVSGIIHAHERR